MKTIVINNLNDGINVKADPSAISDGGVVDCVGFDLTKEGVLETAKGLATNDISASLPVGVKQWMQKVYIGTTEYVLATTTAGLYANGVLVHVGFTGRFKCVEFLNQVYLVNGTEALRFDGTSCYQWGITAPTTMPTITAGTYLEKVIDTFEDLTDWTANQVSCTVAAEAVIKKEGTQSAKITVAANTTAYSYRTIALDGDNFTAGGASSNKDYVRMWMYIDNLTNLSEVNLTFDIGDGTFKTNYLSYSVASPGVSGGLQALGFGTTADTIKEETVEGTTPTTPAYSQGYMGGEVGVWDPDLIIGSPTYATEQKTVTVTKTITKTVIPSAVSDQIFSFWRRSNLFQFKSATWVEIKIPKSLFIQTGDASLGWDTIAAVKIGVASTAEGAVNVYLDGLKFVGGSDLQGDYWFMYTWGRTDGDGNIVHESAPSRNNTTKQVNISGPVFFDRHPLTYAARPLSADAQVDCGVLYAIGGSLVDFWDILEVLDNTTAGDTVYNLGDSYVGRRITSKHNEPAPPGTDIVLLYNKIWMIGDSSYPTLMRSSDILVDGFLAPEGWPTRNAYEFSDNHKALTNIKVLNKALSVKGLDGEWSIRINDPTDPLQVSAEKVSGNGLLGKDAVIVFPTSHVYPSNGGFIETNGAQANFILPEVEPLIDVGMESAIGVNVGLVNYFTYNNATYGDRTAKIDLYRGKARFSNLNNILFDCLSFDKNSKTLYGIVNGEVYIVDSGYEDMSSPGRELLGYLKSKVYRPGDRVVWTRVNFYHNTGGAYLRMEVYVDGVLINNFPFRSTTRTQSDFRFGPSPGYDFQFIITGAFRTFGAIYFPIGVYHSGQ